MLESFSIFHTGRARIFFDSHGGAWWVCSPGHPGAVAFGPGGAARRLSRADVAALCPSPALGTDHTRFKATGWLLGPAFEDGVIEGFTMAFWRRALKPTTPCQRRQLRRRRRQDATHL